MVNSVESQQPSDQVFVNNAMSASGSELPDQVPITPDECARYQHVGSDVTCSTINGSLVDYLARFFIIGNLHFLHRPRIINRNHLSSYDCWTHPAHAIHSKPDNASITKNGTYQGKQRSRTLKPYPRDGSPIKVNGIACACNRHKN